MQLNSSLSNSSNMTSSCGWNQHLDDISSCSAWDFAFSEKTFLAFFVVFLGCVFCSSTANGFLFVVTVRYKQLLWQPQYILIKNMSACGVLMSFVTAMVVLSSIAYKQTQKFGYWCITQFCILRCFFLMTQMTLALMAMERYVFICHGIHYLRIINTSNIHISMGIVWLVSVAVSFHGGFVLSQIPCGFQQQTSGLLCDAFAIKEHITFSKEEDMLMFGPPSVIATFCTLAICYCYGRMYHAAFRVSMTLKRSNHQANRTVGLYFLMFLLQLAVNISFVVLTMTGKRTASPCRSIGTIVTPLLIIIPPFINATFLFTRNPQINRLLFCSRVSTIMSEVEELQQRGRVDETEDHPCEVELIGQVEIENEETTPCHLPGCISPSISNERQCQDAVSMASSWTPDKNVLR